MKLDRPAGDTWQLTRATVRGKSHVDTGLPNQDWVEVRSSPDGLIVASVISDGAGTAAHSEIGSRTTCEMMAPWMLNIGLDMAHAPHDEAMVRDKVVLGIENVRRTLLASGVGLREQHCTFVACVLTDHGGFVCQVGDSIGIGARFAPAGEPGGPVDFFPDRSTRVFMVERGEYANETHFITELDWRDHLRVSRIDPSEIDALLLMTDGAMDVAMTGGKVFRGFLSNLIATLLAKDHAGERDTLLNDWLADRRTFTVTGDDKTMFVAIRGACVDLAGRPVHIGDADLAIPAPLATRQAVPAPAWPHPAQASKRDTPDRDRSPAGTDDSDVPAEGPRPLMIVRDAARVFAAVSLIATAGAAFMYRAPIHASLENALSVVPAWTTTAPRPGAPRPASAAHASSTRDRPNAPAHAPADDVAPDTYAAATTRVKIEDSPPPAVVAQTVPASLTIVPGEATELLVHAGKSVALEVRLLPGAATQLIRVSSDAGPALQLRTTSPPCTAAEEGAASSCVITLTAARKSASAVHELTIEFKDMRVDGRLTMSVPVRLIAANAK